LAIDLNTQFRNLKKKLKRLTRDLKNDEVLEEGADDAVKIIRDRTRRGQGLSEDGNTQEKLKITKSTKDRRKRYKKAGQLSNSTTPNTANLTRSPKKSLLDNLKTEKVKKNIVKVVPAKRDIEKALHLEAAGHKFLGLTKREIKKVNDKIVDKIILNLNRLFR